MSNVTRTTGTYTAHANAAAADVEADVSALYSAHNNHDAGTSKWTVVSALNATAAPLIADNSTGTNDIAQFKDNGTTVWSIADGGNLVSVSKKITGLANGTAASDAAAFGQIHLASLPLFGSETTGGTTTSTSFVDKGATVTITPTSASSKILVFAVAPVRNSAGAGVATLGVSRAGTDLVSTTNSPTRAEGTSMQTLSFFYLDSPATTSATIYQIRLASNGGNTASIGSSAATGAATFICVVEVI
jgi:hypothetical protein